MTSSAHARKPRTTRSASRSRAAVREEEREIYTANDLAPADAAVLARAEEILRARFVREAEIANGGDAAQFLRARLAHREREEFHAVWLDTRHRVIAVEQMSMGTIDGSTVHMREVLRAALRHNAAAVIVAHNHPSGTLEPSEADTEVTERLRESGKLLGINLIDHLVVTAKAFVSITK